MIEQRNTGRLKDIPPVDSSVPPRRKEEPYYRWPLQQTHGVGASNVKEPFSLSNRTTGRLERCGVCANARQLKTKSPPTRWRMQRIPAATKHSPWPSVAATHERRCSVPRMSTLGATTVVAKTVCPGLIIVQPCLVRNEILRMYYGTSVMACNTKPYLRKMVPDSFIAHIKTIYVLHLFNLPGSDGNNTMAIA